MKKAYTILAITIVIFMTGHYAKEIEDVVLEKPYGAELPPNQMLGGPTKFRAVEDPDLDIWNSVLNKYTKHSNVKLISLRAPVEVSTQVVAGVNYVFKFSDDTVITVWAKLDNTVEISEVKTKKQANANIEKITADLIEEYKKDKTNRLLNISEEPIGMVVGGPTQFRAVENSDLHIWNSVLIKSQPEYNNVNLSSLEAPVAVSTQVVSGFNYVFKFPDGTIIKVWLKLGDNALEDRLEVSEVNNVKAFETNTERTNRLLELELDINKQE